MSRQAILFVDDDVLTQWTMADLLTSSGFDVTSVCRAADALALCQPDTEFDVLLTELDLPGATDGVRLGQHWRRLMPNRPIVFLGSSQRFALSRLDARDIFVERPFDPAALLRVITSAIDDAHYRPLPQLDRRFPLFH
jgi:CheY-like chemotaxis protein